MAAIRILESKPCVVLQFHNTCVSNNFFTLCSKINSDFTIEEKLYKVYKFKTKFKLPKFNVIYSKKLILNSVLYQCFFLFSSGLPVFFVSIWAILRAFLDDILCWQVKNVTWIYLLCIKAPVAISNGVNFFFFLNVTRVLFLKLKSSVSAESMKYR